MQDLCRIMTHLLDVLHRKSQTSLVPKIILFATFVLNVVARRLVNRIISQMHVQIIQIVLVWRSIFTSCKSTESLFVKEDSEWVNAT